jgi:hypothetical protein
MKFVISENQYKKLQILSEGQNVKEFIKNLLSFDDNTIKRIQDILVKSNFSIDSLKSMFPKVLTPELVSKLDSLNVNQAINLVRALYNVFIKNKYNLSEQTSDDYEKELVSAINKVKLLQKNKLPKDEFKRNVTGFDLPLGIALSIALGLAAGLGSGVLLTGLATFGVCIIVSLIIKYLPALIRYFKVKRDLKYNLASLEKDLETYKTGNQNQNSVDILTKN